MDAERRSRLRTALALAALAALLSGAFLWPLPAHVADGVAYAAHAAPDAPPRTLVQGDHLQLQYHFDLVHEMVRGRIRAFSNPYEFAVDPAAPAPRRVDPFYFPFALPYALLRFVFPDALCWNLAQLLSVFLGLLFCYLLARRFGAGRGAAFAIAALANCVPYRWVVLAGGSPTGFGMGLVPAISRPNGWFGKQTRSAPTWRSATVRSAAASSPARSSSASTPPTCTVSSSPRSRCRSGASSRFCVPNAA